jgi:alkanesulfonate monooxygenase SsuD/methylene tetrahydromethanopterin reductase-like flavin-dependent oxidoreductase (luciferase family)
MVRSSLAAADLAHSKKRMAQTEYRSQQQQSSLRRTQSVYELHMPSLLHIQQAAQIRAFPAAWKEAGHTRTPRISVNRSVFALIDDRHRAYFGLGGEEDDKIGFLDENTRAIFGWSYAAEPDILVEQLRNDEAIAEADTLLLTIPNQLGVAYNAHVMEAILTTVAPALGWH